MFKMRWRDKAYERETLNPAITKRLDASGLAVKGAIQEVITQLHLIDEGTYRATITHEIDAKALKVKIGSPLGDINNPDSNPPYPLYLEFGTVNMPPFAPMRRGLANSKSLLQTIWGRGFSGRISVPESPGEIITLPSISR